MATSLDAPRRSRRARAAEVLDERLGLKALQYPVPEHANNLGWSLGGLTAAALFILIATGIFLTQFYNPTPEVANASVRHIVTGVVAIALKEVDVERLPVAVEHIDKDHAEATRFVFH